MRKLTEKLFGGIDLSWPKLIIAAVIAGVYTAVMAIIPELHYTSFHTIAVTFEVWILFGILIIVNSRSNLDATLKCFVFFLISQPLVYLIQVPFSALGWQLFVYYRYWFIWTLLCLPMGFIGYFMKKDKWWGYLILLPMIALTAMAYLNYFSDLQFYMPRYILICLFCACAMIFYPVVIFHDKKIRIMGAVIGSAAVIVLTILCLLNPPVYSTELMSNNDEHHFDNSHTVYLADAKYGEVSIIYNEELEDYILHVELKRGGDTILTMVSASGEKTEYDLHIERDTFKLKKRSSEAESIDKNNVSEDSLILLRSVNADLSGDGSDDKIELYMDLCDDDLGNEREYPDKLVKCNNASVIVRVVDSADEKLLFEKKYSMTHSENGFCSLAYKNGDAFLINGRVYRIMGVETVDVEIIGNGKTEEKHCTYPCEKEFVVREVTRDGGSAVIADSAKERQAMLDLLTDYEHGTDLLVCCDVSSEGFSEGKEIPGVLIGQEAGQFELSDYIDLRLRQYNPVYRFGLCEKKVFDRTSFWIEEIQNEHSVATYFYDLQNGEQLGLFGAEPIDDKESCIIDLDGDGKNELIGNAVGGADGVRDVWIYKEEGGKILHGFGQDMIRSLYPAYSAENSPLGSLMARYIPEKGEMEIGYVPVEGESITYYVRPDVEKIIFYEYVAQ